MCLIRSGSTKSGDEQDCKDAGGEATEDELGRAVRVAIVCVEHSGAGVNGGAGMNMIVGMPGVGDARARGDASPEGDPAKAGKPNIECIETAAASMNSDTAYPWGCQCECAMG